MGTVQFGQPYGVSNQTGQVSFDETVSILEQAWSTGIDTLDTAISYGESEQRLGEIGVEQWRIVTKLPGIPDAVSDVAGMAQDLVEGSLERLRVPKITSLLLHKSQDLLGAQGDAIYRALSSLQDQGLVEKIGVSIYAPEELDVLCERFRFDLVQAPFNIIDRRLVASGWLSKLYESGIEVHVRSVFLQGLLLMAAQDRSDTFKSWDPLWGQWHRWLHTSSQTAVQACLGFAMSQSQIDRVIVGVDSQKQFQEILDSVNASHVMPPDTLMSEDKGLVNPSNWN